MWQDNGKTVAHEEEVAVIKQRAERLQLPVHFIATTFATYTENFTKTLKQLKEIYQLEGSLLVIGI